MDEPIDRQGARVVVIWPARLEAHLRAYLEQGPPDEAVDIGE